MARLKAIMDEELVEYFEQYLAEHCLYDIKLFKIPNFGDYIRENGFPQVADTTIRRNKVFRKALDIRKKEQVDEQYQAVITYKTLDVESFMRTNRTPSSIKAALIELNQHYKRIAEAALSYRDQVESLKTQIKELRELFQNSNSEKISIEKIKSDIKELQKENKSLRGLIQASVYPAIANELLKAEGLLQYDGGIIFSDYLEENILTADSIIDFSSGEVKSKEENPAMAKKVVSIKSLLDDRTNY